MPRETAPSAGAQEDSNGRPRKGSKAVDERRRPPIAQPTSRPTAQASNRWQPAKGGGRGGSRSQKADQQAMPPPGAAPEQPRQGSGKGTSRWEGDTWSFQEAEPGCSRSRGGPARRQRALADPLAKVLPSPRASRQARHRPTQARSSSWAAWRAAKRDSERPSALSNRAATNFRGPKPAPRARRRPRVSRET